MTRRRLDFDRINAAALATLPALLSRWLPDGRKDGHEWVARNPRRSDRRPGSFKVHLTPGPKCGVWRDFAANVGGRDPVSLAAYLAGIGQAEAARQLAVMLGVPHD